MKYQLEEAEFWLTSYSSRVNDFNVYRRNNWPFFLYDSGYYAEYILKGLQIDETGKNM